jgi:hypothetical protein
MKQNVTRLNSNKSVRVQMSYIRNNYKRNMNNNRSRWLSRKYKNSKIKRRSLRKVD